jgi:hypothetical protein
MTRKPLTDKRQVLRVHPMAFCECEYDMMYGRVYRVYKNRTKQECIGIAYYTAQGAWVVAAAGLTKGRGK